MFLVLPYYSPLSVCTEQMQNGQYGAGTFHENDTLKVTKPISFPSEAETCQQDSACVSVCICVCTCAFYYKMFSLLPAIQEPLFADLFFFKFDGQEALGNHWNIIFGGV